MPSLTTFIASFAAIMGVLGTCPTFEAAANPTAMTPTHVTVTTGQRVTVTGRFDSIRDVIGEICLKAQVELRSYKAPDRAGAAQYHDRPLSEVLERMLNQENYLLGISGNGGSDDSTRVVWIQVLPSAGSPDAQQLPGGLPVPASFGGSTFEKEPQDEREQALALIKNRFLRSEETTAQFLRIAPRAIAVSLQKYPHASELLATIRTQQHSPAVKAKLDAVIAELEKLSND